MTFKDECYSLFGEYNRNWKSIVYDSTDIIFNLKKNNNNEVMLTNPKKIIPHKFYLMEYIYIKDKYYTEKFLETKNVPYLRIWCPIYLLGMKYSDKIVEKINTNKKLIMYAINLDYLPYKYRIPFFDVIFHRNYEFVEKNKDLIFKGEDVLNEYPLKNVTALQTYNLLKNYGGFEYSLTAYDPSKIYGFVHNQTRLYSISSTIAHRFMFIDCKRINKMKIMETLKESEVQFERDKIKLILDTLDELLGDIESEEKRLYQKLRLLENYFEIV